MRGTTGPTAVVESAMNDGIRKPGNQETRKNRIFRGNATQTELMDLRPKAEVVFEYALSRAETAGRRG